MNFCELFKDQEQNHLVFSEEIDDYFYLMINETCEQDFKEIQNNLLSTIRNFKI